MTSLWAARQAAVKKARLTARTEAFTALGAVRRMFQAAKPLIDEMRPEDRRAWKTRERLTIEWLREIGEKGIENG
jgi:hypothetical protein